MVRVSSDANAVDSRLAEDGRCKPNDGDAVDGEDSPLQSKRSSRFHTYNVNKYKIRILELS